MSAPRRVRLPPQTLRMATAGRMACSARQLVASMDGSRRKRNTAGNSRAGCPAKRSAAASGGGASMSRPGPGFEPAAGRRETVLADAAGVAARPQVEGVLQDRLHGGGPGAVGMNRSRRSLQRRRRCARQVWRGACSKPRYAAHPSRTSTPAEVGAGHGGRVGEPAAGADGLHRRLRGGVCPQPEGFGVHAPAGLVGRDHRAAADLLAQRPHTRARPRRPCGAAAGPAPPGHVQPEPGLQHADGLLQRQAPPGVQLGGPGRRRSAPAAPPAAPSASEVCKGCRPCTRRRHCAQ